MAKHLRLARRCPLDLFAQRSDVWVRLPNGPLRDNICEIAGVQGDVYANLETFEAKVIYGEEGDRDIVAMRLGKT